MEERGDPLDISNRIVVGDSQRRRRLHQVSNRAAVADSKTTICDVIFIVSLVLYVPSHSMLLIEGNFRCFVLQSFLLLIVSFGYVQAGHPVTGCEVGRAIG